MITMAAIRAGLGAGWAWAISPLGRVLLTVLAVLGLLWGVYALGHHNGVMAERSRWNAKVAADARTAARRVATASTISAVAQATHETRTDAIVSHTKLLKEKVPVYVTPEDDSKCVVPTGAVSLLNAAVSSEPALPQAASGPIQATPVVPLSAVVGFGIENTGIGQQWREEALTWRAWYKDQAKAWGPPNPG